MKKKFRWLVCLLALALGALSLTGCDPRQLPRDAVAEFLASLEKADAAALARATGEAEDPVLPLLDPDAAEAFPRRELKTVLGGLTAEPRKLEGTMSYAKATISLRNKDLSAVGERYRAEKPPADPEAAQALFDACYQAETETKEAEVTLGMEYDAKGAIWVFTLPEEFWEGALGGALSELPVLSPTP